MIEANCSFSAAPLLVILEETSRQKLDDRLDGGGTECDTEGGPVVDGSTDGGRPAFSVQCGARERAQLHCGQIREAYHVG